ncbi:PQQ-binding-like beta-propeller repeat protein [Treponema sp. J25]|uniref:outer membrane protein assembly factor BamB family protein n=1 Tax=Treponema sp. J25 TaxID=2094121 RepID=UPI0014053E26|nr:PQQ-binding-like beta-propeller repeat protein [Treponema sp. J25]
MGYIKLPPVVTMRRLPCLVASFMVITFISTGCSKPKETGTEQNSLESAVSGSSSIETGSAPLVVRVVFVEGAVVRTQGSQGEEEALVEGTVLTVEDVVRTTADGSVELAIGDFATVRVLPQTIVRVSSLFPQEKTEKQERKTTFTLESGRILTKVKKLVRRDEFIIRTGNAVAAVRGTQFMVAYEPAVYDAARTQLLRTAKTTVAVRDGTVAALPVGALMDNLLNGKEANPLAQAVVTAALALGPRAAAGQEIVIGGAETASRQREEAQALSTAEEALSLLLVDAQNLESRGTDWELVEDPTAILGEQNPSLQERLKALSLLLPATLLSAQNQSYMELFDRIRDPGEDSTRLPAALPERFKTGPAEAPRSSGSGQGQKQAPGPEEPPSYPAVLWSLPLGKTPLQQGVGRSGEAIIVLDTQGILYGISKEGKLLWKNEEPLRTYTALDRAIAGVSEKAVILVDGQTGIEQGRWGFDGWSAIPQSKPVPIPEGLAVVTPRGIAILRSENAQLIREVPVEGGVVAPPVLMNRFLAILSGKGRLLFLETRQGTVVHEMDLSFNSLELWMPRFKNGSLYVVSKQGELSAVEEETYTIRWKNSIGKMVLGDPEVDEQYLYLWIEGKELLRVRQEDGSVGGAPIGLVDTPPLLSRGRLYFGRGQSLIVMEGATGKIIRTVPLPEPITTRPLFIDGRLFVGTRGGKMLKLDITE